MKKRRFTKPKCEMFLLLIWGCYFFDRVVQVFYAYSFQFVSHKQEGSVIGIEKVIPPFFYQQPVYAHDKQWVVVSVYN